MNATELPCIIINAVQPREIRKFAIETLVNTNNPPTLFHLTAGPTHSGSGRLVQILNGNLSPLNETTLRKRLQDAADWLKLGRGQTTPCDVPPFLPKAILQDPDGSFPRLIGVIRRPVFVRDPDGNSVLVQKPGYHQNTGLYYHPTDDLRQVNIPLHPTSTDIEIALSMFDEWTGDFPFDGPAERANCLAMVLTSFVRPLIDGPVPLFDIEAPRPAMGKTLLAKTVAMILEGNIPATRTIPIGEDEIRKMVTAELRIGRSVVILDNADRKLTSPKLAEILTSQWTTDRLLGKSEMLTLPNFGIWILTANNPQFSDELNRRRVRIRLDTHLESAELRQEFKHQDLLGYIQSNRACLVSGLLTLIQAWVVAGSPLRESRQLPSFEAWSSVMAGILNTCGIDEFLANNIEVSGHTDSSEEEWGLFFADWFAVNRDRPFLPGDVVDFCLNTDPHLLNEVRGGGTSRSQAICLGKALPRKVGCSHGKLKLIQSSVIRSNGKGNRAGYRIVPTADAPPSPHQPTTHQEMVDNFSPD